MPAIMLAALLGAVLASSGAVRVHAMGMKPVQPSPVNGAANGSLNGSDHSPHATEALLFRTLLEIRNNRPAAALAEVEKVLQVHPNFRLAHLIRGDLLLARTRPLTTLGNAQGAPQDQLADLREEARARLARYQHERPTDRVPRYLVQLQPDQKHALLVDTSKSTLYVFENHSGTPRYVTDYYISIGKNGIDKFREGDRKTPLGVYHVTRSLPRDRLDAMYGKAAELYGVGALPINYPNEWDRRRGRNGYGIWLHGVPFDTYSRPPLASDGCVALTNEDFEAIGKTVQVGLTPVIISSDIEWISRESAKTLQEDLARHIEAWRSDWESLNTEKYLAHYAINFSSGKQDLAAWATQKRRVNAGKTWIRLGIDRLSIFLYPGREELAVITFDQNYASNNLSNQMRKRQYWIKEDGRWKIIHEGPA
ncbi:MAG: L,D-transpeptidase family protein [Burkholderiales bacterium]|nr:L,D-transpeptidase family protein [Burkholderiales bacterium]